MPASENKTRQTFPRTERLKSRKIIEQLMLDGKTINAPGFKLIWMHTELPESVPVQTAFAVPKKRMRLATDRNRIKRMMREAYRKNKSELCNLHDNLEKQSAILFVYNGNTVPEYRNLEEILIQTVKKFVVHLSKNI
ncbi:MAG: ribonuclease P protein component [Bacteroidetes bacterium]|nr:MAG: ribonuclease P protein component [Bacteroidota bacterium]REK04760.1 MAG: ribonuclease P protein component [Bacteroidota bacterium]REK36234.1 MAG: ribonuclease P protein component [Bacteroidota bacterium]REK51104.1 MAG: ribonuclease P protein component [Bacteroidota bacterium]